VVLAHFPLKFAASCIQNQLLVSFGAHVINNNFILRSVFQTMFRGNPRFGEVKIRVPQRNFHYNINKNFWEELIACFPWYDTGHSETTRQTILLLLRVYWLLRYRFYRAVAWQRQGNFNRAVA
jgi:hypothetical protein